MNAPQLTLHKTFKALIVNDSVLERNWLTKAASQANFMAITASSLDNVLDIIEHERIDLVICDDEHLQHQNALQLCHAILQARFDFFVYVMLLGAENEETRFIQAIQAGADEYMRKPVNREEMHVRLAVIERIVAMQRGYFEIKQTVPKTLQSMARDMRAMGRFQASLLPQKNSNSHGLELDYFWTPKVFVSGDMLQWLQVDEQNAVFYVFDVVGHGVASAMNALDLCRLLSLQAQDGLLLDQTDTTAFQQRVREPNEILNDLNQRFQMNAEGDSFISILLGTFCLTSGELKFSIAGTPRLAHQNLEGAIKLVGEADVPVGIAEDTTYPLHQLNLQPGERVFVFSDGLTQMLDNDDTPLGLPGVLQLIEDHRSETLHTQLRHVRQGVVHWSSGRLDQKVRSDDCTFLALQWKTPDLPDEPEEETSPKADSSAATEPADADAKSPAEALAEAIAPESKPFVFARRKENSEVLLLNDEEGSPNLPQWLSDWGYHLHVAKNLTECEEQLTQRAITFFVIDLQNIPQRLQQTLEAARKRGGNPSVFVLIISNAGNATQLLQAIEWGADNFTQLAYSPQEIYVRLASGLRLAMVHRHFGQEKERIDSLHKEIEDDVRRVSQIQSNNVPQATQYQDMLHVFSHFRPARPISNQFMNVMQLADGHIAFFHLSAQGSGLVGVARGMTLHRRLTDAADERRSVLSKYMNQGFSPGAVLREINSWVLDEGEGADGVYALCYGVINPTTGDARISHAGYPNAVVTRARGEVEKVGAYGPPLGVSAEAVFQDVFFSLNPGDRLFVFSNSLNDHPSLGEDFVQAGELLFAQSAKIALPDLPKFFDDELPQSTQWSLDSNSDEEETPADLALLAFQYSEYAPVELHTYEKGELRCMELELQNLYPNRRLKFRQGAYVKVAAKPTLIPDLNTEVTQWLEDKLPGDERSSNIQLALFEVASNLCRHAGLQTTHTYELRLFLQADQSLLMMVMDKGSAIPTDRLEDAKTHDFDFDIEQDDQIPLGGMGLALVHTLASEFTVQTIFGMNYTSMWFDVPTAN
ncbi:SpoIIE family protein phosphatase [Limnobacter sp.]|uniref:ATP-binding SpoIIE family protein phosphatase n=1 Tax=Limnobacter sp. TaxID=2003368 RepID=UPI003517B5E4